MAPELTGNRITDRFAGRRQNRSSAHLDRTAQPPSVSAHLSGAETDFGRLDIYRALALAIGLDPPHRRAALWREIKAKLLDLVDQKHLLPVWIIDEAQNLPPEFFRDLPSFLNFAFDSRDLITIWLVGHPNLAKLLDRNLYEPINSRIHARVHLDPIEQRERFRSLIRRLNSSGYPSWITVAIQSAILSDTLVVSL